MRTDMKEKETQQIEKYFNTESQHLNSYAFDLLCKTVEAGQFADPETALQLFHTLLNAVVSNAEHPVKAVQLIDQVIDKSNLAPGQKLFLYEFTCNYLKNTEYPDIDTTDVRELMSSNLKRMKAAAEPDKPLTMDIRETLKGLIQKELESLPDTLKGLEPLQRLNILCKLIPFILPKVDSVHYYIDENQNRGKGLELDWLSSFKI